MSFPKKTKTKCIVNDNISDQVSMSLATAIHSSPQYESNYGIYSTSQKFPHFGENVSKPLTGTVGCEIM